MAVRIEDSFELLTQQEWDNYLGTHLFDNLLIHSEQFNKPSDIFAIFSLMRLDELLIEHNNKVGSVNITYALCRHYFDKGIPDDPWYISPGNNGQSIQYFPLFQEEHWMRQTWFNFFSDAYYLKISSLWDSIMEIINHYYELNMKSDLRMRDNVLKWLKENHNNIYLVFCDIMADPVYESARQYRTSAAHGTSAGSIQNKIKINKEVAEITDMDEKDQVTEKKVRTTKSLSIGVGDYVNVKTIMKNMEEYAIFIGYKIQEIISLLSNP